MDCKAARLYLSFPQDGPDAPSGPEAAALRDHRAVCGECDAAFRAEARFDAHLGRAMRDVPVPSGLKGQLLARLAAERAEAWRKRVLTAVKGLAAAAAVLLVVSGVVYLASKRPADLDAGNVRDAWSVSRPFGEAGVEAYYRSLGYPDCAPDFVRYEYLLSATDGELPGNPGRRVPRMVFAGPRDHAVVLAVNRRQFRVAEPDSAAEAGYKYRVEVKESADSRWTYLVLYTGDNWDWLRAPGE